MIVDGYELGRELARGGMGVVHEAVELASGRRVALKRMLPAFASDPEVVARFLLEAQAAARLRHPAIVAVHAAGRAAGAPYLVMELVAGESLQRRLDRAGPLEVAEALPLFERLADALAHAHAHGVVHRDLKPSNVLLDASGAPRLTDFGLARLLAGPTRERLTRTGEWVGTPSFMAPEQAQGSGPIDERTDVYGLGATLYAALTGRPPFEAAGALAILHAVLTRPPPAPSRRRPGLPPAVDAVVLRCLAKDPAARPESMRALGRALHAAARGEGAGGSVVGRRALVGGTIVAVAAVAVAGAVAQARRSVSAPLERAAPVTSSEARRSAPPASPSSPAPPSSEPPSPESKTPARPPRLDPFTPDQLIDLRARLFDPGRRASLTDEQVEQLAEQDPENPLALLVRADRRLGREELEGALDDCERGLALVRDRDVALHASALRLRVSLLLKLGRAAAARAALDAAIVELPNQVQLRFDRLGGLGLPRAPGDLEVVLADMEHVIAMAPERRLEAARAIARKLREAGRAADVQPRLRAVFDRALDPVLLVLMGDELVNDWPTSEADARALLDLLAGALERQRTAALLRCRARVRILLHDPAGALQDRLDALPLASDDAMAHLDVADSLVANAQPTLAIEHVEAALRLEPARPDVASFAVVLLDHAGAPRRALEVAEAWLAKHADPGPLGPLADALRKRLR